MKRKSEGVRAPRRLARAALRLGGAFCCLALVARTCPAVDVWVTTGDKTKLLRQETDRLFAAGTGTGGFTISVDSTIQFQTIDGFGAALTDSSAWLIQNKLDAVQRSRLQQLLFSPEAGIGLNYLRLPLGASDFTASGRYTYNDQPSGQSDPAQGDFSIVHDQQYVIPQLLAAQALNPALKLMGSPWSAPAWMKTNLSLFGGQLQPQYEASYALYLQKFVEAYEAAGLPIDAITLQNEPLHTQANYPTMGMSAAQQADIIKNHLGPALAAADIDTKILAYDHNWDNTAYPISILDDPAARQYVAGTAFHGYAGSVTAQSTVHDAHPDKGIYFTEITGGGFAPNFDDNLVFGLKNVIIGGVRNWSQTALYWNLALDENHGPHVGGCSDCRGVVTIDSATGAVTPNEEFYTLAHVSKFVAAGAVRIDSRSIGGTLETAAFLNPDGSRVLVALNPGNSARNFRVVEAGDHLSYSLPGKSAATFVWNDATAAAGDFDNGGFDELVGSTNGWIEFGNVAGNVAASGTHALGGTSSLRLSGQYAGAESYSGVSQGISVSPGDVVKASVSSLIDAASMLGDGSRAVMKIEFFSRFNGVFGTSDLLEENQVVIADASSAADVWLNHGLTAIAPAGAAEARIVFYYYQASSGSGVVFLDDTALSVVAPPLEADFDGNGVIDAADLAKWSDNFGMAPGALQRDGDATGDGRIDGDDFLLWQRQVATPSAAAQQAAIPEPRPLLLTVIGVAMAHALRRSRQIRRRTVR